MKEDIHRRKNILYTVEGYREGALYRTRKMDIAEGILSGRGIYITQI
jgi:hypothetical protein